MPRVPSRVQTLANGTQVGRTIQTGSMGFERTGNRQVDAAQSLAMTASAVTRACPLVDGNLIVGVSMNSLTLTPFNHLLGRQALGAFPVRIYGNQPARWSVSSLGDAKTQQITAVIDTTTQVDWWVF